MLPWCKLLGWLFVSVFVWYSVFFYLSFHRSNFLTRFAKVEPLWNGAGFISMAFVSLLLFVLNFVEFFAVGTILVVGCGGGGKGLVSVAFLVIFNIVCIY